MKGLAALLSSLTAPLRQWNVRVVAWMFLGLAAMVAAYSAIFHQIMAIEGRVFSWATSIYWTLTTMSTLGFGDITFESDGGRLFSVLVLVSGALYILVLLPFAIIQFIFSPWMDQREQARAPRRVPDDVSGHIVVTRLDSVTQALIARARRSKVPHVVIATDPKDAAQLQDAGYRAMVGPLDDPNTYRNAGVERASLVAATHADTTNTNIAFTVREINHDVPISATADSSASVDVLELAGCDQVIELATLLGAAMARRVLGTAGRAHVVGEFGSIRIAEARVNDNSNRGRTLRELGIDERCGLTVLAVYEDGQVQAPHPGTPISNNTVLILGGGDEGLAAYDQSFSVTRKAEESVVVLGGGRVGRAAARVLAESGVPHTIVEREEGRVTGDHRVVHGDAAELQNLQAAGLDDATAILVTTHEDDMNVYLTLYCRRLRPDVQIIARAVHERNVTTLHRAGADSVLSYAAMGATSIWNTLGLDHRVVLTEGIEIFAVPVPNQLIGRPINDPKVARETGCHIVAVTDNEERAIIGTAEIPAIPGTHLLVIGDRHDESLFRERYWK
ncbi:MAG TPA: NAD-binding protein [Acidimicrobiia bacterium]|nr:NAD-binding protein [Acidimicrobiia bacterium]